MIPPTIKDRFAPWNDCLCWCLCNEQKQPINRHTGNLLAWKLHPGDHVNTLDTISGYLKDLPRCGFGIIVGRDNTLACFDLDDSLNPDGKIINPLVKEFLDILGSFVEVSSSGSGLHAFVELEGTSYAEFGFDKAKFCGGKFYPSRFIKLTGNVYEGYDLPIKIINKRDCEIVEEKIGITPPIIPAPVNRTAYTGKSRNWDDILSESGILHISAPQYIGKSRLHGMTSRTCIASWKIQCPNKAAHSDHHRHGDFSADAAILSQWSDGTSSCSCNHNSCSPALHPNLLHKLWQQVHKARDEQTRARLHQMGVMV
jgi:hypothetical protein